MLAGRSRGGCVAGSRESVRRSAAGRGQEEVGRWVRYSRQGSQGGAE